MPALPPSAQGKLYLYESATPGAKLAATEAVWAAERRVVRVPPEQIGGADHVVALCPGKWCICYCAVLTRLPVSAQASQVCCRYCIVTRCLLLKLGQAGEAGSCWDGTEGPA